MQVGLQGTDHPEVNTVIPVNGLVPGDGFYRTNWFQHLTQSYLRGVLFFCPVRPVWAAVCAALMGTYL